MMKTIRCALLATAGVWVSSMGHAQGFVSVLQVMDDMIDTPYECADYDPVTDSCSGVSLMYSEEGIIYNAAWFALPDANGDPWVFEAFSEYEFLFGWGCPPSQGQGAGISYKSGGTPELGAQYAEQIEAQVAASFDPFAPCAGYYPAGPRQYVVEFRHRNGELADQASIRVQFFAEPKTVRP
ncbi:hypothetical protein [Tritonibacter scottomollicae]|uniref:hypothetical protein n=1 Tax=Tritonibacter scottomollicae TaxID=483013 RepID=UPI003AA94063